MRQNSRHKCAGVPKDKGKGNPLRVPDFQIEQPAHPKNEEVGCGLANRRHSHLGSPKNKGIKAEDQPCDGGDAIV